MTINHHPVIYSLSLPLTFVYNTSTLFKSTEPIFNPKYGRFTVYGHKRTVTALFEAYLDFVQCAILRPYPCTVVLLTVVTVYGMVTSLLATILTSVTAKNISQKQGDFPTLMSPRCR
jgi:hypothetical protein